MASKRKRLDKNTLIIIGVALGVETLAAGGVVMGIHNKKVALEKTLAGKETALADVRTVSAGLPALRDQYARMQTQVKFLERGLPPAEYIPTLLGQVEETARASGVTIQSFRPRAEAAAPPTEDGKDKPAEPSNKRQFDMTVNGSYASVQKFLLSLTKFRKILSLDSIQLQPVAADTPGASPSLNGNLGFTAYILPPAPAEPAPGVSAAGGAVASTGQATAPRG